MSAGGAALSGVLGPAAVAAAVVGGLLLVFRSRLRLGDGGA